jgi:glucose dehydrogenase
MSRNLGALGAAEPYDVCIVGSGPAGTVLGTRLVEAGVRTIILESGGSIFDWLFNRRLKELAAYEFTGDTSYPLTRTSARAIGGNSNFWTGRSDRFHPSDFEPPPYTPPDNPWPIRYRDLAPYYDQAERTLRVRGGPFSEHMPPRDAPLALPAKPDISALKELMRPAGVGGVGTPPPPPRQGGGGGRGGVGRRRGRRGRVDHTGGEGLAG